jgi:hypothetical protein
MKRLAWCVVVGVGWCLPVAAAEDSQRGTIKGLKRASRTLVVTVDGKDRDFLLTFKTTFLAPGEKNEAIKFNIRYFQPGTPVQIWTKRRDDRDVVMRLRFLRLTKAPAATADTSRLILLTELGATRYQEFQGGLYPDGGNQRPADHERAGRDLAAKVGPRDPRGRPSPDGKVGLISICFSDLTHVFSLFKKHAIADPEVSPQVVLVSGPDGLTAASRIVDPAGGNRYWMKMEAELRQAGVEPRQVQVVWIAQADPHPTSKFPEHARLLQAEITQILNELSKRFPHLKLAYLSSRPYAGYARTPLGPEPFAYESAFAVKWLIGQQLKGDAVLNFDPVRGKVRAPWVSWGPYFWANGTQKRADGLFYTAEDFRGDGTHLSTSGQEKVVRLLLQFFKNDTTTQPWFLRPARPAQGPGATAAPRVKALAD